MRPWESQAEARLLHTAKGRRARVAARLMRCSEKSAPWEGDNMMGGSSTSLGLGGSGRHLRFHLPLGLLREVPTQAHNP
jgi:hypothetical protein